MIVCLKKEHNLTPHRESRAADPISSPFEAIPAADRDVLNEKTFRRMLAIERKRTERSKEPFLLMLLDSSSQGGSELNGSALENMANSMLTYSRETDIIGWYKGGTTVGVMFTGLVIKDKNSVLSTILSRVKSMLRDDLVVKQLNQVSISFHFFPDDWDNGSPGRPSNPALYPDLTNSGNRKRSLLIVKRVIDVMGTAFVLALCSPLFLAIALAIKLTSKGPVLFRQQRIGQYGKLFTFLKFRSMYVNNDHQVHRKFVTSSSPMRPIPRPRARTAIRSSKSRMTSALRASESFCAEAAWMSCRSCSMF